MPYIVEKERKTRVSGAFTVAVCGGGIAGISAALSAARAGADVLLIENQFLLGGLATSGLVTIFLPLCDGEGHQVSFGICEELIRLSVSMGYDIPIPKVWQSECSAESRRAERYQCRFNPQLFAILCEQLLLREGVTLLYGSRVCGVEKRDGRISHIVVENKGGRAAYAVRAVVDATGDADVCFLSDTGTVDFTQGNSLAAWYYALESGALKLKTLGFCDVPSEDGTYMQSGESVLSRTRYRGLTGRELTDMVVAAHGSLLNDFKRQGRLTAAHSPVTVATIPQVRMTRRIDGRYTLDDSEERKAFRSSIGMVSDWRINGKIYELPMEALYAERTKNLVCAGRNISVTESMWDITRVIPVCAVTGEAAGIAAALTDDVTALDPAAVQAVLIKRGVPLHISDIFH